VKIRYVFGLLIATALVSGATQSYAQAVTATPEQREAMQIIDELRTRLALTPGQEAQIAPLLQARNEKLKALRDSSNPGASRREKVGLLREARRIQKDFVEQVEPLLSKEQKKEWDAIREEMQGTAKEKLRERRSG
jgi:hypothetical protein